MAHDSTDWKWQIANRISTVEALEEHIELTDEERSAFDGGIPLSFAVTPHYARLLDHQALRRTVIPTCRENHIGTGELAGRLWTPGVRIGVQPGSWFHRTECFGPVLGVLRAVDLDEAIELQNATDFGLTGGIHSLDPTEIAAWLGRVEVGNAYVNRAITGAIVQRQPFGGWKKSSVGGSSKAGGPSYVQQFARVSDQPGSDRLALAETSYSAAWHDQFTVDRDPSGLLAETNVLRYVPVNRVVVRHDGSDETALALLQIAASVSGVRLDASDARIVSESEFVAGVAGADRVRLLTTLSDRARRRCHELDVPVDDAAPISDGFVELTRWVREQAVSRTMHRHGRLNSRIVTDGVRPHL